MSHDRSVWSHLCLKQIQEDRLPLPDIHYSETFRELTSRDIEALVLSTHLTERRWLSPRLSPQVLKVNEQLQSPEYSLNGGNTILYMKVHFGRWLFVAFAGVIVEIWDLNPTSGSHSPATTRAWLGIADFNAVCKVRYPVQGFSSFTRSIIVSEEGENDIVAAFGRYRAGNLFCRCVSLTHSDL
jgi:hypothetical protein